MGALDRDSLQLTSGASPLPRTVFGRVNQWSASRLLDAIRPHRRLRASQLIAALNEVAAAVSSTIAPDEVLETIVERAKWITNTEKAALILTLDHTDALDEDTLVVKGARDEHPQDWWQARLQGIASRVFTSGQPHLALDRENHAWLLCAPIRIKDRPVGILCAINSEDRRFTEDQVDFLATLGAFAATAIENSRLAEQNQYVLLASERDRIAREMHDGISQSMFSVALGLEVCRKQIARDPAAVARRLEELQEMVDSGRAELRRFIYDLRPVKLQELGLVGAIEYWVREITSDKTTRSDVVVVGDARTITPSAEACLYRVAKEAISNVIKHSGADHFEVRVLYEPKDVILRITDNGSGFERAAIAHRVDEGEAIGLRSIEERVKREGGTIEIESTPGHGTRVEVSVRG